MVQHDWVAVDFCYYAIMVEIDRTRLKNSFSPVIHRECLVHSRQSLGAFHFIQQHAEEMPGFEEPYPSFLTWFVEIPGHIQFHLLTIEQDFVLLPTKRLLCGHLQYHRNFRS